MIEARFDDLTGVATSFRLSGPVGVIEATRTEEVAGTIAAAEAAAARGLWVAGFVAYEAAPAFDPSLRVRGRDPADPFAALPLVWFAMFERREETTLPEPRAPDPDADGAAAERGTHAWLPSIDRERYDAAIARIREHIAAGDTYQVNFTLRLRSRIEGDERGLYRDLCYAQRGAHAAYLNLGRYRVLSASPELFVRARGRTITTRPMKGTAPRGRWPEEDEAFAAALVASAKDRAENAMIVDLLRNDLGRVSRPGSVAWSHVFEAERYETVWQLTSTVTSELRDGVDLAELFAALFPSGSVTGAPKVRSMQIIAELEDSPRGVYCGAVGWIGPAAEGVRASFNVAIRTVTLDAETGTAEYGVGGGITWDSVATSEFDEAVAKARVLATRRPPFELLETMRRDPGEPIRRAGEHRRRLERSAAYFGYRLDPEALASTLASAGEGADHPVRIRLRLARSGAVDVAVTRLDVSGSGTVRVALDEPSIDPADPLLFHKTTLRGRYEAARARHPDADEVLLVNVAGEVTEASSSNVAVRLDGRWWTPPLRCGLLPGTEREVLLARGTLAERAITTEDVRRADGLALLNSVRGWRDATLVSEAR
ncbi:MAG TPA: aminodeoxychorismate synthase component I [Actinomycetota bacterium]